RERPERLFRIRDLHGRQVEAPQLARAALCEIPQRMSAAATQLERAEVRWQIEQPQRVFGRRQRPVLRERRPAVKDWRDDVPSGPVGCKETLGVHHLLPLITTNDQRPTTND